MLGLWVFSVMFVSYYVAPSGQWSLAIEFGRIRFADFQASNPGWTCLPFYSNWKEIKVTMPWTEFARAWLGFGLPGIDYDLDVNPDVIIPSIKVTEAT